MSKATFDLPDELIRDLKVRASESEESLSSIVADALRQRLLEDSIDITAYRARKDEPSVSLVEVRSRLGL